MINVLNFIISKEKFKIIWYLPILLFLFNPHLIVKLLIIPSVATANGFIEGAYALQEAVNHSKYRVTYNQCPPSKKFLKLFGFIGIFVLINIFLIIYLFWSILNIGINLENIYSFNIILDLLVGIFLILLLQIGIYTIIIKNKLDVKNIANIFKNHAEYTKNLHSNDSEDD